MHMNTGRFEKVPLLTVSPYLVFNSLHMDIKQTNTALHAKVSQQQQLNSVTTLEEQVSSTFFSTHQYN